MDKCNLCNEERDLRESHIIPKFIFKWLKDTGTGYLRSSNNLNQRVQDGTKEPFLCSECEERFSKAETYFAQKVFKPIVNNATSFEYSDNFFYAIISILWRLLKHTYLPMRLHEPYREKLILAEQEWSEFLLNKTPIQTFKNLHLLIGVDIISANEEIIIPERFIQYIARYVDADIADTEDICFMYLKLPRFLFFMPIYGMEKEEMINTIIDPNGDVYIANNASINSSLIGHYLFSRVNAYNELRENISPIQKEKMRNTGVEKWDELKEKDLGIILEYEKNKGWQK